jgi:hypothetical protein
MKPFFVFLFRQFQKQLFMKRSFVIIMLILIIIGILVFGGFKFTIKGLNKMISENAEIEHSLQIKWDDAKLDLSGENRGISFEKFIVKERHSKTIYLSIDEVSILAKRPLKSLRHPSTFDIVLKQPVYHIYPQEREMDSNTTEEQRKKIPEIPSIYLIDLKIVDHRSGKEYSNINLDLSGGNDLIQFNVQKQIQPIYGTFKIGAQIHIEESELSIENAFLDYNETRLANLRYQQKQNGDSIEMSFELYNRSKGEECLPISGLSNQSFIDYSINVDNSSGAIQLSQYSVDAVLDFTTGLHNEIYAKKSGSCDADSSLWKIISLDAESKLSWIGEITQDGIEQHYSGDMKINYLFENIGVHILADFEGEYDQFNDAEKKTHGGYLNSIQLFTPWSDVKLIHSGNNKTSSLKCISDSLRLISEFTMNNFFESCLLSRKAEINADIYFEKFSIPDFTQISSSQGRITNPADESIIYNKLPEVVCDYKIRIDRLMKDDKLLLRDNEIMGQFTDSLFTLRLGTDLVGEYGGRIYADIYPVLFMRNNFKLIKFAFDRTASQFENISDNIYKLLHFHE